MCLISVTANLPSACNRMCSVPLATKPRASEPGWYSPVDASLNLILGLLAAPFEWNKTFPASDISIVRAVISEPP